jgi:HAD superfamily hydrolase (TIGR01549 family)
MTQGSARTPAPKAVLLDVGMTLIHPNGHVMAEELLRAGATVTVTASDCVIALAGAAEAHHLDLPRDLGRVEKVGRSWGALLGISAEISADAWAACAVRPDLYSELDPHAHELLEGLRRRNIRVAAVSNDDNGVLREELRSFALLEYFDATVDSAHVGSEKPAPGIFYEALDLLGCGMGSAWFLGDGVINDMLGSLAVGIGRAILDDPHGIHTTLPMTRVTKLTGLLSLIPSQQISEISGDSCASAC